MRREIKFHSIMYRYFLFIFLFAVFMISFIADSQGVLPGPSGVTISVFNSTLMMSGRQLTHTALAICIAVAAIFSFVNYKCSISEEGIYLKKIGLLVPWDEIVAISHIWMNDFSRPTMGHFYFYNRKTIVIYRKQHKPICVYNISLLALYVIKWYHPEIKTNIVSATLATVFNMTLNLGILYGIYSKQIENIQIQHFMILIGLYATKVFAVPLLMVAQQNYLHGAYLTHATGYQRNASDTIHV
ncbi:hypothetical protein HMPREF0389_01016 [Filifactor alocis ATCC 35896]|uniref:Uncharacterized protein n=1 Tax=Filifactor alocis (strain ATCC 35896 / CCUG 47790 / D40 B5) TaxID=546269 RepID=D6GQP1_FILAD|nr:hypothetical protein [Filifactor alocis]EFE29094.1 hypothetical protein HMPREF0389_01016 [Filifactor alocis ATCC 35896]